MTGMSVPAAKSQKKPVEEEKHDSDVEMMIDSNKVQFRPPYEEKKEQPL
jgi:hypothetical protein